MTPWINQHATNLLGVCSFKINQVTFQIVSQAVTLSQPALCRQQRVNMCLLVRTLFVFCSLNMEWHKGTHMHTNNYHSKDWVIQFNKEDTIMYLIFHILKK